MGISAFVLGKTTATIFWRGVDNLLCLESLTYGTDIKNLFLTCYSGLKSESYILKDRGIKIEGLSKDEEGLKLIYESGDCFIPRYFFPRYNTVAAINHYFSQDEIRTKTIKTFLKVIAAIAHLFFVPYLSFKFKSSDIQYHLKNHNGISYRIIKAISPLRIGISGIIIQGFSFDLPKRMAQNREQVLKGVTQVIIAIAMTTLIHKWKPQFKMPFVLGLIFS